MKELGITILSHILSLISKPESSLAIALTILSMSVVRTSNWRSLNALAETAFTVKKKYAYTWLTIIEKKNDIKH